MPSASPTSGSALGAAAPSSPPRLMVLKLVLENFKSWGGVKEVGPFHKAFSAVVGPNGSGAWRVVDATPPLFSRLFAAP